MGVVLAVIALNLPSALRLQIEGHSYATSCYVALGRLILAPISVSGMTSASNVPRKGKDGSDTRSAGHMHNNTQRGTLRTRTLERLWNRGLPKFVCKVLANILWIARFFVFPLSHCGFLFLVNLPKSRFLLHVVSGFSSLADYVIS